MCDVKQTLTSVLNRNTDTFGAAPYLSKDGTKAYINYQITVVPNRPENTEAEWFDIINGQLISTGIVSANNDNFFTLPEEGCDGTDNGAASDDFTRFSLLDEALSNDETSSLARLRIYDQNHNLIGQRIFGGQDDPYPYPACSFSLNGGNFSKNNKYVVISYVTQNPSDGNPAITVLRIIDVTQPGLPDAFTPITYNGNTGQNPDFVTLKHKCKKETYVFTYSTGGTFNANLGATNPPPPYLMLVYKLGTPGSTPKLVLQQNFGQSFGTSFLQKCKDRVHILVSVIRNVKPGELSEYIDNSSFQTDNGFFSDLGIYEFDGLELKLLGKRSFKLGPTAIWHPSGNYILARFDQNESAVSIDDTELSPTGPNIGVWLKVEGNHKNLHFKNADADLFPMQIRPARTFSKDGKWLLVTASNSPFATNTGCGSPDVSTCVCNVGGQVLYNITLYKIKVQDD